MILLDSWNNTDYNNHNHNPGTGLWCKNCLYILGYWKNTVLFEIITIKYSRPSFIRLACLQSSIGKE